jgi:hypothetical protein
MSETMKYTLQKVTDQVEALRGDDPDDLFLVASSFEPRSIRAAGLLKRGACQRAVIFQYEDTLDSTGGIVNYRDLKKELKERSIEPPEDLPCKFSEPYSALQQLDIWFKKGSGFSEELIVTVDITCFTKLH